METILEIYNRIVGEELRPTTEEYRRVMRKGDPEVTARMKRTAFPALMPACVCAGFRRKECVTRYTGLCQVDFDKVPAERTHEVALRLKALPETLLLYRSMGNGLHLLYRYEGDYRQAFRQGNQYFAEQASLPYDPSCEPIVHLSSLCHDPEAYLNLSATAFVPAGHGERPEPVRTTSGISPETAGNSGGTTPLTSDEICRHARELVERRMPFMQGQRHNHLVRLCYLLNDYGVPESDTEMWIAMNYADYRDENPALLVRSVYQRATASFGCRERPSHRPSARKGKDTKTSGGRKARAADEGETDDGKRKMTRTEIVEQFLRGKPLRYDIISQKTQRNTESSPNANWKDMTDRDTNSLYCECCRTTSQNINQPTFRAVLSSDIIHEAHPLREFIEELPPWDGQTDYISQASGMVHVKDPAKQSLWASCFKKWFVAMVASWMADEVTNHEILVLIGRQGIYKTTWIDRLMPPQLVRYRSKQSATGRLDKDEMLRFCEFGLINMDEIDSMPDREVNTLKSLITSDDIVVRAVYATNKERRIRLASYAASGNKEQFLTDTSGNRRWLPFEIESIDSPFEHPLPYAGIYAQAYQLSKDGFRHWFDLDEIKGLEEHVEGFMEETSEGQLIPVYFAVPTPGQEEAGNAIFLTLAEISAKLTVWGAIRRPLSLRQLGKVMTKQGFRCVRRGNGKQTGYLVIEKTSTFIEAERKLKAR